MKKSELKQIIREEYKKTLKENKPLNEVDLETVKIPTNLSTYMDKFIAVMQKVSTTDSQKLTIIYQIIKGLGIAPEDFSAMYAKLKTQMNSMPTENIVKNKKTKK